MDADSWALNDADLLEQMGSLVWVSKGDATISKHLAQLRIGYELYQRLSGQRDLDALRNQTILNIAKWLTEHPKASKEEVAEEIGKHITQFAEQLERM